MSLNLSSQVAAANALAYATAPFSQGFTLEDYRSQYAAHGERVRVWKAAELPDSTLARRDGQVYVEQELDEAVRVFLFEDAMQIQTEKFGLVRVGDARFASLPEEIELARGDRVLAIDRPKVARCHFTPSGTSSDLLPRVHVVAIDEVFDGVVISPATYELEGRSIKWLGTPPAGEVSIRYRFLPQFEFRGEGDRQAFLGSDGKRLPQFVPLHLVGVGEEV